MQQFHRLSKFIRGNNTRSYKGNKKFDTISEANVNILLDVKEKYRAAELHRFSTVRAFTSKEKWNHFQTEKKLVKDILTEITHYFKSLKN